MQTNAWLHGGNNEENEMVRKKQKNQWKSVETDVLWGLCVLLVAQLILSWNI